MPGQPGNASPNSIRDPKRHASYHGWPIRSKDQPIFDKLKSLPGLILTTILSSVLVYGINERPFVDHSFYSFVMDHRSSTQAVLSLLTGGLSILQIYVLKSMINLEAKIQLLASLPPTLERLKWWKALAAYKIDRSLPLISYLPMLVLWTLALLPNFLWTGALTPNLLTYNFTLPIDVPFYPPDPDGQSWNATWTPIAPHNVIRSPWGSFSYTPAYDRGGSMINTAAGVIADKDSLGTRPRSDKTGYTYTNRSYGVGSSIGLAIASFDFEQNFPQSTFLNYQEVGYYADVLCGFNTSSEWGISNETQDSNPLIPNIYLAAGATPNNAFYWQLQYSAVDESNVVSINADPGLEPPGIATIVIATGRGLYSQLNQSQCNVTFKPTLFNISVDINAEEITVEKADSASDMDPTAQTNATFTAWNCQTSLTSLNDSSDIFGCSNYTAQGRPGLGNIATRALRQLNDLSTQDMSLHTSNLGEMFLSLVVDEIYYDANFSLNISDFETTGIHSSPTTSNTSALTYSIEQGLKSLIDDSLLAFASAQIALHYDTSVKPVNGTLTTRAIQFGTKPYVYAIFAFNILLILLFIEEAFRTHFWATLPLSNYNDLKSVVVASSIGGAKRSRVEGDGFELLERAGSALSG